MSKERRAFSDRAMGISASRRTGLNRLDVLGPHKAHGSRYEPTPPEAVVEMVSSLDLDLSKYTFVDLGSGRGRVVCLASMFGFDRIVGVEFGELHVAAEANLRSFSASWQRCRRLELVHGDVADYALPPRPLVLFLYNPFRGPVLLALLDRIRRAFEAGRPPIHLLYFEPVHADLIDRARCLTRTDAGRNWVSYRTLTEGADAADAASAAPKSDT